MRLRMRKMCFALLVASTCFPWLATAATIQSESGLPFPDVAITFDEIVLQNGTPITDQYSSLGITFSNGLLYNPGTANMSDGIVGFEGRRLANFYPVTSVFSIFFSSPVVEAVLGVLAPNTAFFTALLNGEVVESFQNTRPSQTQGFYGFNSIVFDELRIDAAGISGFALVDNIQFTTIPEPSTGSLLGLGLLLVAGRNRPCRPSRPCHSPTRR